MHRSERGTDGPLDPEQLEFLAAISTEWEYELRRRRREEAEAARQQELQEFVNAITTPDWPRREQSPPSKERQEFVDAITRRRTVPVREENWDPAKHPRRGGPPNAGWWASTRGGADATGANTAPATTTIYSPSTGAAAHLTAANPSGGHHWVPQEVFGGLKAKMTRCAYDIFKLGTESPDLYNHANDPWNGVKHWEYSDAVRDLLQDWIRKNRGKLGKGAAQEFLSWIAKGKCDDAEFLAQHEEAFAKVFKWRAGFKQSIVVAARAKELNPNLTGAELKAIAQQFVNGESKPLSRAAAKVAQGIIAGGKAALKATAKKVLPGLMFLSAATAAKRGWSGEGHTGSRAWGAANEAARDAIIADLVEKMVFPKVLDTVDGIVNVVAPGLNDPTRYRILQRGGVRIDMRTGLPIE